MNRRLKILSVFIIVIIISVSSLSFAGEPTDGKKSDFSGAWKFQNDEKKPPPQGQNRLLIFSLEISQKGDVITGKYEYITYNATRIREGIIRGKVKENTASLQFSNPDYNWEKGKASLNLQKNGLNWKMTESPRGEHFLPATAVLKKVIPGKGK